MIQNLRPLVLLFFILPSFALAQICDEPYARPSYKSRGEYCQPGQQVQDAYAVGQLILCEEMEVDHLISLRQAWESGVCGEELARFANDPKNLRFTHWSTNRRKGRNAPEVFASTLPAQIARTVTRDANELRAEYKILDRTARVDMKITQAALGTGQFSRISTLSIPPAKLREITYRRLGQRTLVILGGRTIGYVLATGIAIEAVMISAWALNKLTSPSQTESMKARADLLTAIFDGE